MKKRILSFLLAAVILVGTVLATGALAAEDTGYEDVDAGRWSAADIIYVSENGMMKGVSDTEFAPASPVTRAMVVTVLHRLAGSPKSNKPGKFVDVPETEWYAEPVAWGAENDIVKGFAGNKFAPNDPVTREQLVTFIGRFASYSYVKLNGADISGFADSGSVQPYAEEFLKWAVKYELLKGLPGNKIGPAEGATREQFAAIMHRYATTGNFDYELAYNEPTLHSYYTEKEYPLVDDADFYVAVDGDDAKPRNT